MLSRIILLFSLCTSAVFAQPAVDGPGSAGIGAEVAVTISGSSNPRDFVAIVPKGSREGTYDAYQYASKPGVLKLQAPSKPGEYEIRLLGAQSPYPTLARQALRVESVAASLDAPAQVAAGARFDVRWSGPNNARDYVGIGDVDPKKRAYISYVYTSNGSPIALVAPDEPGEYELRYFLGTGNEVIAQRRISVGGVSASLTIPPQVAAGAQFPVAWKGPGSPRDFITLVKAGTPPKQYERYEYTAKGSPLQLRAPDQAGEYEVRYLTAQSYATLASAKLSVTAITGSVQGPVEAVAGTSFPVSWKGPNNLHDYITIVPRAAREGDSGNYAYTARGNPASLLAPIAPGEYELRYATAQSHSTLARAPIRILPDKQEPGLVSVTGAAGIVTGAVEIILDASGSMLQRIGSQRRIDIAKQTLTKLTATTLPANTPFALRVFGREVDSCQTDLDIALSPLNAAAVGVKIAALEAKNNARTPIGASLEKVADDLKTARGERLVIVLTDGEETCGGDPAAAIEALKQAGVSARVSIVGFAIDDPKLAATFRHWSDLGNGTYYDAQDATGLSNAMSQALRPGFELLNAQDQVVAGGAVGGDPVRAIAGKYTIRLTGQKEKTYPVVVKPKETATVQL
jgi:hypothetical protein